jgi:hypothetical protein
MGILFLYYLFAKRSQSNGSHLEVLATEGDTDDGDA